MAAIRKCKTCGKEKPLTYEYFRKNKDWFRWDCRECEREMIKEYGKNNPEKIKEYGKKHREENKEYYQIKHKLWKEENPNYYKEYSREFRKTNADRLKESQREYEKEKYHSNINYKLRILLGGRLRRILKQKRINKNNKTFELLGCSIEEFKDYIGKQFKDGMTWFSFFNGEIHIDHIRPCASFDLTNIGQLKTCFHYSNLQPLWAEENYRKGAKWPHLASA